MKMLIRLERDWVRYTWNFKQHRWNNVDWKGGGYYRPNPILSLRKTLHAYVPYLHDQLHNPN